jgi:endonuclease YncB( thermonuclease family)
MTRYFFVPACICLALHILSGIAAAWEGIVVKVLDGDSLQVREEKTVREIRLYGIDAPEYGQAYGKRARRFARRLAHRQPVRVEVLDIDRYGRAVSLVWTAEHMLNRELVRAGLAWHYPRYCRRQPLCSELEELQAAARKQELGLWRAADPLPPWQWKRQNR